MHTTGVPPVQVPLWQVSPCVQTFPSLQVLPLALGGFEQPVAGLQVPATWHWSLAVHTTGVPALQTPDLQVSPCVQLLPSSQALPFGFFGFEQVPFEGLQVPARWQVSDAVQTTGFVPVQVPFWQVSLRVQALASLQVVPLAFAGFEQTPVAGLHVPAR